MQYPLTFLLARLSTGTGRGFLVASFHTWFCPLPYLYRPSGVKMDSKEGRRTLALSFVCKSPPQARDCPMKEKLAGCRGPEGRTPRVNPLHSKPLLAFFKKTGQTRRSVTDGIYSMAWNRSKATLDAVPAKEEGKDE
ncbi:hypothetical protein VNO78_35215 [Psophocarpus tetragonolobus]|uniref:Uncharacterized protein n=1 Tax=Psophocarpus tetragonolobus TaxID=3891 RepID=A0AAN9NMJ9_PSOTE